MRNFHDLGFRLFINVHQDFQALLDEINKQIILEIYAKSWRDKSKAHVKTILWTWRMTSKGPPKIFPTQWNAYHPWITHQLNQQKAGYQSQLGKNRLVLDRDVSKDCIQIIRKWKYYFQNRPSSMRFRTPSNYLDDGVIFNGRWTCEWFNIALRLGLHYFMSEWRLVANCELISLVVLPNMSFLSASTNQLCIWKSIHTVLKIHVLTRVLSMTSGYFRFLNVIPYLNKLKT